ncbi:hypothetical protein BD414DRAFT_434692 [Trametes punicea]|nr:hypothetical protein BD414DRAFT_434692 [Trametes punicea]
MAQPNRLHKAPQTRTPGSHDHAQSASGISSARPPPSENCPTQRRGESRTMAFARELADLAHISRHRKEGSPFASDSVTVARRQARTAQVSLPESRSVARILPSGVASSENESTVVQWSRPNPYHYVSFLRQYFAPQSQAMIEPVTVTEHHLAVRASRAEALLEAHTTHRKEIRTIATSLEERRSRDLAEVNARFSEQFAKHEFMMWVILGLVAFVAMMLLVMLWRQCRPGNTPSHHVRPVHFTIPVLSPFTSVIENETSVVNVQLVALLLLSAGVFAFLWFRCAPNRR